jgi:class 3 adenylate cyclase
MTIPETRYARSGELTIAYQVYGSGGVDVIATPPSVSNIEVLWDWPPLHRYFERWGSFARVAQFDKRGMGLSDRVGGRLFALEERMEDFHAVIDAAGFEAAAIFGLSEGSPMALLFAASYPERTRALVLQGGYARMLSGSDYTAGVDAKLFDQFVDLWTSKWGTPDTITQALFFPSQVGDAEHLRWTNRYERQSCTPAALRALMELEREIDVREVCSAIRCPTLVLHNRHDRLAPIEDGRWLAEHIPGARLVEFDGGDHFPGLELADEQLDVIEHFLTGELRETPTDRALTTVLFTDIVDSTAQAASVGDARWRSTLDRHFGTLRGELTRHRGREIELTGDGLLAIFDSPTRAIRCARGMVEETGRTGPVIRAGLHTGEIERRGANVAGIAVHIAARVMALANANEVLVSAAVPPLVLGSGIEFADRGDHELKGVPGKWHVAAVV